MEGNLAYSEIYEILNLLEDKYRERVPKKVIDFFEKEREKEYKPVIDVNIPLEEQNLQRKTIVLLATLKLNYWCDSEEEKKQILNSLIENEKSKRLEEYNPNKIFEKTEKTEATAEMSLTNYKKQNFIQKIISRIMDKFRRKNL